MKEKPNIDCEKYRQIAQMAKMGWWESDLKIANIFVQTLSLTYSDLKATGSVSKISTEEYGKTIGNGSEMNTFRSQT